MRIRENLNKVIFFGTDEINIGCNVFINNEVIIECRKLIEIKNDVKIGYNTVIIDTQSHSVDGLTAPSQYPIIINNNVWIGANVTILSGVQIGANSVIASGYVVNNDIPQNTISGVDSVKNNRNNIYKSKSPRK